MLRSHGISVFAGTVVLSVVASFTPAIAQPVPPRGTPAAVLPSATRGDRASFTMLRRNLSDRSQLAINVASGNVIYEATDLDINGVGQNLTIRRFFNSVPTGGIRPNQQLPGAWRISVGEDVSVGVLASGDVTYRAADGSDFIFTKQSDGSFTSPAGINAKLSTSDGQTYKLRFNRTGVTLTFLVSSGGGSITESADRNGNKITYHYGQQGESTLTRLLSMTDSQGRTVSFTWGGDGSGSLRSIRDSSGRQVLYNYGTGGGLTSVQDATGRLTLYSYTAGGLGLITSPDNHLTTMTYSGAANPGRVETVTYGAGSADASQTTFAYPDASTTAVTDAQGHTTTYTYDTHARVTRTVDPLGHSRSTTYTANDDPSVSTDAMSAVTRLTYDNQNNLTKIQAPDVAGGAAGSGRSVLLGYPTPNGSLGDFEPTSSTDPQGNQTTYGYNANGNLSTVNTPAAAGGTPTNKYQGDAGVSCGAKPGELCSTTDGAGHVTSYSYDTAGNLTEITPPAPLGATTIAPDGLGRPSTVTDGKGQVTSYGYDADDRITEIRYAGATSCSPSGGNCIQYSYDGQGDLTGRADVNTTSYAYDAQRRLTSKVFVGPANSPNHQFLLGYDFAGNLISYTDSFGTISYGYDAANRVVTLAEPGGSCPAMPTFPNSTHCTGFSYDNNDRRTKISFPSGQSNNYSYDTSGRMTSVAAKNGSTVLRSENYGYATAGKDTGLLQSLTPNSGSASSYGYDPLNRIKQQTVGSTNRSWTYDKVGNRLTFAQTGSPTVSYAYNAADELCWSATTAGTNCTAPPSGATSYSYDANGNLTAAGGTAYTYDAKNQTTQVGGTTFTYTDADSTERVRRSSASEFTTFFNSPLGVTAQTGNTTNVGYTRDPQGNLVDMRVGAVGDANYQSNFYTTDRLGSTLQLNDSSVATTASYSYDAYGVTTSSTGSQAVTNPYRYASGMTDPTSLIKFGTRYDDPTLGRWTQRDPIAGSIADPGRVNRYPYVADNPANKVDPSGAGCAASIAGLVLTGLGFAGSIVQFAVAPLEGGAGFIIGVGLFELSAASLPLALDSVSESC